VSWQAVQAVIAASREPGRFDDAEFRVALNLAEHLNGNTGRCDPSLALLGAETNNDRRQLRRVLDRLEQRGEVTRDDPSSKGGRGRRQSYSLLLKGDWPPPIRTPERVAERPIKGGSDARERVTPRPADLRRSATTRKEPGKNQRERAGSTPDGAGRARDEPQPIRDALGQITGYQWRPA
jgi:hypothetical protein